MNNNNNKNNTIVFLINNKNIIFTIWKKEKLTTIKQRSQVISDLWDKENHNDIIGYIG
jgi:hypothetical protein